MSLAALRGSLRPQLALVLASLIALASPAAADVIIVDPNGGGDFTALDQALAAAVSGDIVILRPADYTLTTLFLDVDGKALVIAGDGGGAVTVPGLQIHNVPAGGTFVLRHLIFQPNAFTALTGTSVRIDNSAGNVHIEDCTIVGRDGQASLGFATLGLPGLLLADNPGAVAIHRSTITGGAGQETVGGIFVISSPSPGAHAITSDGGRLALFDVMATGGRGGDGMPIDKFKGPFLPGVPFFGPQFIASTNGSGSFAASFVAPSLVPFGLEGLAHVDRALMVQPGDGLVLGSATAYVQYQR